MTSRAGAGKRAPDTRTAATGTPVPSPESTSAAPSDSKGAVARGQASGRGAPLPGGPGMGSAHAPPFLLPGAHFGAGVAFFVLGALGIVAVAGELAGGFYLDPRVAAVTHLLTLGWITTSIMGALYQFLPVALGVPVRSLRAGYLSLILFAPGTLLFAGSLFAGATRIVPIGAGMLAAGLLVFLVNLLATLKGAATRDVTWWALLGAAGFLGVTLATGVALATNLHTDVLGGQRVAILGMHVHVALAGWVFLVVIGVARHLLPMFLLSHGAGERWLRRAAVLVAAGAGTLTLFHAGPPVLGRWLPGLLLLAGLAAFLGQAAAFYRRRSRPRVDPPMKLAAAGLAVVGVGGALAIPVLLGGASPRVVTAYGAMLVLGLGLFVAAHYYKIIPFLVWYHRFGPLAGRRPVPRVSELYSAHGMRAAAGFLVLGVAGLAAGILLGAHALTVAGAAALAAGAAVEAAQVVALFRRRPA